MTNPREVDDVTAEIVDAAFKIHSGLGPGLLESVYQVVLCRCLLRRGLQVESQKSVIFDFDGISFDGVLRIDALVEGLVVVEIKSVEQIAPVHPKQLLTYLRLMNLRVGLLINFGAPLFKSGVQRVVNRFQPSAASRLRVNQMNETCSG